MQNHSWIQHKESKEQTLDNLKHSLAFILAILDHAGVAVPSIPALYLGTLEEVYKYRKSGFVPAIAERRGNNILFYYEILHDVIVEINKEEQIDKFVKSLCLHEMLHIILNHKTDTEENRQRAEEEANAWMTMNAWQFEAVFLQYMPLVDRICEKHKKK